jgi:lysophospholipase L1-like esterase
VSFVNSGIAANAEPLDLTNYSYVHITNLSFNAAFTQIFPAASKKLIVYGDSILDHYGIPAHQKAWTMQVRANTYGTWQVALDQRAAGAVSQDTVDATARTNRLNRITALRGGAATCVCYIEHGTNAGTHSVQTYQTEIGNFIDEVRAVHPDMTFIMQTRMLQTIENGGPQQFRDYASAIVATKSGCTRIQGEYLLAFPTYFLDGLHPNNAGMDIIATRITNILLYNKYKFRGAQ